MTNHMTQRGLIRGVVVGMAIIMLVVLAGCGGGEDKPPMPSFGGYPNHWVVLTSLQSDGVTYNMNDPLTGNGDTFNAKYGDPATRILAMQTYYPVEGASIASDVPVFRQNVDPWQSDLLGTSAWTIKNSGCAVTSVAMLLAKYGALDVNPGTLNKWLTDNGGYTEDPNDSSVLDQIDWKVAAGYLGPNQTVSVMTSGDRVDWPDDPPTPADLPMINTELAKGPVVVGLELK